MFIIILLTMESHLHMVLPVPATSVSFFTVSKKWRSGPAGIDQICIWEISLGDHVNATHEGPEPGIEPKMSSAWRELC